MPAITSPVRSDILCRMGLILYSHDLKAFLLYRLKFFKKKGASMSRESLRDDRHQVIGYIETESNGKLVGRDARFIVVGYYDPQLNMTKDHRYITDEDRTGCAHSETAV